jgi:hypothetical protein
MGIEPATFRYVARFLNQMYHPVPPLWYVGKWNFYQNKFSSEIMESLTIRKRKLCYIALCNNYVLSVQLTLTVQFTLTEHLRITFSHLRWNKIKSKKFLFDLYIYIYIQ